MTAPITCAQAAARHNVSRRRIQVLAQQGRIPGAKLHGNTWLIPDNFRVTPPPLRARKLEKIK